MNNPWLLILLILGVYRISILISRDTILEPIRKLVGRMAAHSKFWWLVGEWMYCPYCNGVWIAAGAAIVMKPATPLEFIVIWLGIAGAQAFMLGIAFERNA